MPLSFVADSSKPHQTAVKIVDACEKWLRKQSQKHVDLTYFQVHYILLLAKQINSIKPKRTWTETGNLLRLAMATGMHRDTRLLQKKTTAFQSEMRRRFWALVVEMDLQASLDRGMPASSLDVVSDCGLPSNLRDEDFDESSTILPTSRPATEITKMSYLRMSNNSHALRKKLTNLLNQPGRSMTYSIVRTYTEQIERQLSALPSWHTLEQDRSTATAPVRQSVALLHIQMEQFLLILHASAARRAATDFEASFSKAAFFTAAKSVIHRLSELALTHMKLLVLSRYDVMRVFVSLAHLGISTAKTAVVQNIGNDLQPWLELAAQTLDLFEDRILRSGPMQWSYCFALYDLLQRFASPGATQADTRLGCDKIFNICRKMLDHQDPTFASAVVEFEKVRFCTFASCRISSLLVIQSTEIVAPSRMANLGEASHAVNAFSPEQAVYPANGPISASTTKPDLSEWNFDDWMLYSDTFFQQNLELAGEPLQDIIS